MRTGGLIGVVVGISVMVWLATTLDFRAIGRALSAIGWGIAILVLYRFLPISLDAGGWRALMRSKHRPSWTYCVMARWVGESVNTLLPVAQIGGDVARARLIYFKGVSGKEAGAVGVVDFTLGLLAQALFTVLGVTFLWQYEVAASWRWPVVGLVIAAFVLILVMILAQRSAILTRMGAWLASTQIAATYAAKLATGANETNREMVTLYRAWTALSLSLAWKMTGWFVRAGEVWLAVSLMGGTLTFVDAIIIESLSQAIRSAAFAIPGALGAQEAGIVGLGIVVGLDLEIAAAVALIKRAREVLIGVPGLIVWWRAEQRSKPSVIRTAGQ